MTTPTPADCGNCREPMEAIALAGHYGRSVEVDLCSGCHLVWFDTVEPARLSGPGMLALIGRMAEAQRLAHRTLDPAACCPRCRGPLKRAHNRTRWGRSLHLECLAGHGSSLSFAEFLGEKGLLRPLSATDRERLRRRGETPACVNCGATVEAGDESCRWCGSVPSLIDVARLAAAIDPEGATEQHAVHGTAALRTARQCLACGSALPADAALQCPQCGATLAASRLADAHAQVLALGPALAAHAVRPAPHVVKRRMDVHLGALARERETVTRMRAENDAQLGRADPELNLSWLLGARTNPLRAVFIALAIWWIWWFWG
jgi:RNA polymerase subunit RPABC4/transcription elongation factor Spt4